LPYKEKTFREKLLKKLNEENFDLIYANSVASAEIIIELKKELSCKVICHIRELEISIIQFCGKDLFQTAIPLIDLFIADSEAVRINLVSRYSIPESKVKKVYEYIILKEAKKIINDPAGIKIKELKNEIGIPEDAFIVVSSGTTDWRKGADLVVHIANLVRSMTDIPIHFIWIGGDNNGLEYQKLYYDTVKLNLHDRIHFFGVKENPLAYFAAADVFMLCSREEPVGIVALEAASLGKPVLCFDQAGGMPEFVEDDCGFILPYLDLTAMANHIVMLQKDRTLLEKLGSNAALKVQRHDINLACKEIEKVINSEIES
jgi:glycosyltransferase involved in cell wall biosynthesis